MHSKPGFGFQHLSSRPLRGGHSGWRVWATGVCLIVSSCATGDVAMMANVSGGQKIRVELGRNGVPLVSEDGVQINTATFAPNADKKIVFVFEFTDGRSRALRSVRVEDVSEETPVLMVESVQPKLSATGQWRGETDPLTLSDRRLGWLATLPNTLRVYRFTLIFSEGKSLILQQGTFFPAAVKSAVRQSLGENY